MLIYTACLAALLSQTNSAQRAPNPIVTIETSMGQIKIELFEDKAPATVKNFLSYVDKKHYENTIFHRVIGTFMIQGGGHEPGMKERKTDAPIVNESNNGLSNVRGTIAMARTADADSARSQFFINVVDNTRLDRNKAFDGIGYCVFGKVIDGMDVIDKIKAVKVGDKAGHQNVPIEDVVIKSIKKSN